MPCRSRGRLEEAAESMQIRALFLATLLATLAPAGGVRAAEAEAAADAGQARLFPRPAGLEPQIHFWRAIFTQYSAHQVVLHDAVNLDKVYKVLDFRSRLDDGFSDGELAGLERIETDVELDRLRATLLRLHALGPHPESLTAEERAVYDLWADDPAPDRFLAAADDKRLHGQRGLRERFAGGIRASRPYFPEMERIFREEGLPVELVRLPLIESCFDLRAYSKAGAAGVWQFMPKTGRLFMRVDNLVDERRDPISSTRAAARFLARVHDMLDTWPLTITAYNHGPQGVARAVSEVGTTDIATIVRDYHGKAFGFASRNFYVEFLAALAARGRGGEGTGPPGGAQLPRAARPDGLAHREEAQGEPPEPPPRQEDQASPPAEPEDPDRERRVDGRIPEPPGAAAATSAGPRAPAACGGGAPGARFRGFSHLVRSPAGCGPIRCFCVSKAGAALSSGETRRRSPRRRRASRPAPRSPWSRPRPAPTWPASGTSHVRTGRATWPAPSWPTPRRAIRS